VSAIYGLRALLRRLAVVSLCLLAAGCSSLSGQGYLFTQDSKPLQLAEDVTLKQGHMRLEFNPDPWLLGRLRLHDGRSDFKTWVSSGDYAGNSFFIDSQDSGLAYDIQARWQEIRTETAERDEYESCTASGYCSQPVRRLDCGRKSYREGTERYEDHEDDSNCEEESTVEQGNFSNCPGRRQVRKRYQVYKLLVGLEFREPFSDRPPVAEFDGESRYRQRLLETLSEGQCQVY
jgi:hypothetical protein